MVAFQASIGTTCIQLQELSAGSYIFVLEMRTLTLSGTFASSMPQNAGYEQEARMSEESYRLGSTAQ